MLQFSSGVTVDTVRNHYFLCDKKANRWLEISKEAELFLRNYFDGVEALSEEETKFVDFLFSNGYLTDTIDDAAVSKIKQDENMQIIIETSSSFLGEKSVLENINVCNNVVLKYNPEIKLSYYLNMFEPTSIIVDEENLGDFLEDCKEITTSINIIINYEMLGLEKLMNYISELYINGIESIDLYYNVDRKNIEKIETFICLSKEYMLGFNWSLAWCSKEYDIDMIYNTLRNVLIAYDKYKFATYPTSPLFKLNSFLPCYKCNFPQNKKYISADGKEKMCMHIKKETDDLPMCCVMEDSEECENCSIRTFCPFKNPTVCKNNCKNIRFLQEYVLCIFSNKLTISENVANLDGFFRQFCREEELCGKI